MILSKSVTRSGACSDDTVIALLIKSIDYVWLVLGKSNIVNIYSK
jgi:hypothetical protein